MSGVDMNTQKSFEKLDERCVAVVIDPIQSVKGKVGWNLEEGVIEGAIALYRWILISCGVVYQAALVLFYHTL